MRFTKVFGLLAAFVMLSGTAEARKYLEYLPEPRLRNSSNDYSQLPTVVPLGGDRYVWFADNNRVATLRSGGVDRYLAGNTWRDRVHPGVGTQASFGSVLAAVRIPGTDDVLVMASPRFGDVSVLRLSLDGRVREERRLANPDAVYDMSRTHWSCFQCEEDGTVYCSNNWTRLYRFKLGVPGVEYCDPATEDDGKVGNVLPSDSLSLLVASPTTGYVDGYNYLTPSVNPRLTRLEFNWGAHSFSVRPAVEDAGISPPEISLQQPAFVHDGATGESYVSYSGFASSGTTESYVFYKVSGSGTMELVGVMSSDRGIWRFGAIPFEGDLLVMKSGVPASLYRFREGVLSFETSFGRSSTPSYASFKGIRKAVTSGTSLLYSLDAYDFLGRVLPSGETETVALGDRPPYEDSHGMLFFYFPSVFDLAGDGEGGAYVTYYGINAVYHVLPNGEQKRLVGLGVVDFTGKLVSVTDGPVETAGVGFPSLVTCLTDHSVVFLDDGRLRRISGGFVTTLGSVDQGESVDGPLSSARWTNVRGLARGPNGSFYALDGNCIRKVDAALKVTTVAGIANEAGSVDGLRETARFYFPQQLAVDSLGRVFVLDNGSVRMVEADGVVSTLILNLSTMPLRISLVDDPVVTTLTVDDDGNLLIGDKDLWTAVVRDTEKESLQLQNFSARGRRGEAENSLTLGFSTMGNGVSLMVRGVGPSLADFGVTDAAGHAGVRLLEADGAVAAENDDWSFDPAGEFGFWAVPEDYWAFMNRRFSQLGAFALSGNRHEGALTSTVAGGSGFVTLQPQENEANGVALLEVYNEIPTPQRRLTNCSIRGLAGGEAGPLVGGFVLEGQGTKKILARVSGPALRGFGIQGALVQPKLRFYNRGRLVAEKVGWENDAVVAEAISRTGAFPYVAGSQDCALALDLPAGNYTVEAESVDGSSGVALVEIYVVP